MNKELEAILNLLDDPDPQVSREVTGYLIGKGASIVPELEKLWEQSANEDLQERIENIIDDIQFHTTFDGLLRWRQKGAGDLLEGAFWLSKYQYPDLQQNEVFDLINQMVDECATLMRHPLPPLENIRIINHVVYQVNKFSGSRSGFFTPQNFYINNVIERQKGNPLSLGLIYIVVAQRLNLPVYGTNLPVNFLLGYWPHVPNGEVAQAPVHFFINPYSSGAPLSQTEVMQFLKKQNITPAPEYFAPMNNTQIILRFINNLIFAYDKMGYPYKVRPLTKLKSTLMEA